MNAHAKDLLRDALALTVDERAELAEELLASIDADSELEQEWGAEIEQRARRALACSAGAVPWETVRARAFSHLLTLADVRDGGDHV